ATVSVPFLPLPSVMKRVSTMSRLSTTKVPSAHRAATAGGTEPVRMREVVSVKSAPPSHRGAVTGGRPCAGQGPASSRSRCGDAVELGTEYAHGVFTSPAERKQNRDSPPPV